MDTYIFKSKYTIFVCEYLVKNHYNLIYIITVI